MAFPKSGSVPLLGGKGCFLIIPGVWQIRIQAPYSEDTLSDLETAPASGEVWEQGSAPVSRSQLLLVQFSFAVANALQDCHAPFNGTSMEVAD